MPEFARLKFGDERSSSVPSGAMGAVCEICEPICIHAPLVPHLYVKLSDQSCPMVNDELFFTLPSNVTFCPFVGVPFIVGVRSEDRSLGRHVPPLLYHPVLQVNEQSTAGVHELTTDFAVFEEGVSFPHVVASVGFVPVQEPPIINCSVRQLFVSFDSSS